MSIKRILLLLSLTMLTACTSVPVAVQCPKFPQAPQELMQPAPTQYLLDNVLKPQPN